MSERLPFAASELRARTIRGVAVNAAFLVVVEAAALAQGLIVARILGPRDIGLYGIVSITVMTLIALKRVGIDEAYVQQDEEDQEREFQLAFSLELALAAGFALLIALAAPLLVVVYDEPRLLPLTLALTYLPLAFALQAPLWIFFRRMDFLRQRSLQAIVPIVTFVVTVPLAVADVGVWSIVIGAFAGNAASVALALRLSPYRLAIRFERDAARRYFQFSWPVLAVTAAGLVGGDLVARVRHAARAVRAGPRRLPARRRLGGRDRAAPGPRGRERAVLARLHLDRVRPRARPRAPAGGGGAGRD